MSVTMVAQEEAVTVLPSRIRRFTIEEYNRLTEIGFFTPDDRVELLDGLLVTKMAQNPPHAATLDILEGLLPPLLPEGWTLRSQKPVTLMGDNLLEPDVAIVRGPKRRYFDGHPTRKDVALIVEVADTTLVEDRAVKQGTYARARIPVYWIVNLVDRQVEVYTLPRGGKKPAYRQRVIFESGEQVPIVIEGETIAAIAVRELLP